MIKTLFEKIKPIIPDKIYLKLQYKYHLGQFLNLDNPQTFNEKIQWLKLYDRKSEYTSYVDKYEVRKHIRKTIGEEYLIPLIGVYDDVNEIDWNSLPEQFVLKCTHGSSCNIVCKDKSKLNIKKSEKKLNQWMNKNWYWYGREWPYKNVKPRIICESYMVDESGYELKDYKLMCFNGEVKMSFVCLNRSTQTGLNVNFYDLDWNILPFERKYKNSDTIIPKPKNYYKMIELAEKLSKGIPFVRVDFYEVNEKIYFGELTLHPGSGFEEFTPIEWDYKLGSMLRLPE